MGACIVLAAVLLAVISRNMGSDSLTPGVVGLSVTYSLGVSYLSTPIKSSLGQALCFFGWMGWKGESMGHYNLWYRKREHIILGVVPFFYDINFK